MVDEVHERSVDNDILVGLLKKIIQKRQDLRIIISSASVGYLYNSLFLASCQFVQALFPRLEDSKFLSKALYDNDRPRSTTSCEYLVDV